MKSGQKDIFFITVSEYLMQHLIDYEDKEIPECVKGGRLMHTRGSFRMIYLGRRI